MRSLIWKEWREQSWKAGFACVILTALAIIGLHARVVDDESMVLLVCMIAMILLPILTSASLLGVERSEGSFEALLALPVSPRRILLAKTFVGVVVCTGPLIVAAITSIAAAGNREMSITSMWELYARCILVIISMFIWMLALTVRLPSEMRAGLLATGVLIFWMLATQGLIALRSHVLLAPSPLAFISRFPLPATDYDYRIYQAPELAYQWGIPVLFVIVLQACIALALWFLAASRMSMMVEE